METVRAQKDRSEDQRPAVVYQNPWKKWTTGDFAREAPAGLMVEKRRQKGPECNNGIKNHVYI
jgi:hypothetical protein